MSRIAVGIILRMTATCTVAGMALGGIFGSMFTCPWSLGSALILMQGLTIGLVIGGIAGLVLGLVSGVAMARATLKEKLYSINITGYKKHMDQLSKSVVVIGTLLVCILDAAMNLTEHRWVEWLLRSAVLILIPGLIAFFTFGWASNRVAEWVIQNANEP